MSLTSAMLTGVSGLLANGEAMNVIGNNISNVNTVGFKGGRSLFSDLLSENTGDNSQIGKGVQMQSVQNFFTQGSTQSSENVTDLAIQGNSFFALTIPSSSATVSNPAQALLTRSGAFRVDSNYNLVNADGYKVLDSAGVPIKFTNTGSAPTTDFGKITKIDSTGNITYLSTDGITQHTYPSAIGIVSVPDTQGLTKLGNALYQPNSTAGVVSTWGAANKANGSSEQIISNALEQSNVDMAGEFVKMIVTQRAYSANSKTITTSDQMTQEALNLIR
jgi:flagellar hook protein FlgE